MLINKQITQTIDVFKILDLYKDKYLVSAKSISLHYGYSFDVIAKILQAMHRRGYVKSVLGIKGGYKLTVLLDNVSLLDIYQMVNKNNKQINKYLDRFFNNINVRDILDLEEYSR